MTTTPQVRHITRADHMTATDRHAVEQLRAMTGLSEDRVDLAIRNLHQRLVRSQRSLVQLEPVAGGPTMTVRASSLLPTARSLASLRGVEVPGYRIKPLPKTDLHTEVQRAFQNTVQALTRTFREPEDAQAWMQAPNEAFSGDTPAVVLEQGQPSAITTVLNAARQGVAL